LGGGSLSGSGFTRLEDEQDWGISIKLMDGDSELNQINTLESHPERF
jgi:hypothetical protein